ncbi:MULTISPECIES: tetratricopeptide repeat protein [unclassified Lacinutrix]
MKHLIIIVTLLITSIVTAQTKYEQGMHKALDLWKTNPIEASQLFERIAKAEPDNWLPPYYAAETLILDGFRKMQDADALKVQLDQAQCFLNDATAISKDNPEIMVMQAILYTVYVASDGATYGMMYSAKVMALYAQAEKLAPNNPRVVLNKADWNIGGARYFGQDIQPFCTEVERALELFATFKPETEFHPNWGRERAQEIIASCK